ncbi:MAG: ribosomal protein S18 acetylase RimI-like enzyme [Patiriisocius sp.]|jgi:ribosomal protein S18 acetylase RimI-like enzyme
MIRKAKASEIVQLISMTKSCAAHMINQDIYQWNEDYPNITAFENDFNRGELYVLYVSEILVGCITISTFKDTEYDAISWLTEDAKQYYIHRLAVAPAFQKQGYAKQLMDFAEAFAASNAALSLRLDTFSQNKRNQRFYENRGYQRLGSIYFPNQSEHPFYCYEFIL